MAQPVKVSDDVMAAVREAATLQNRSIAGQVEHWIQLGRAFERAERFNVVERALRGLISPDALSEEHQEEYLDRMGEMQWAGRTASEAAFYADREAKGLGVGMDEAGKVVYASDAVRPR